MSNSNKPSRVGFALILIASLVWSQTAQAVCFVNAAATGGDGTSWVKAYTNLQTALASPSCNIVFVARGTYKPTATTDRTISFRIPPHTLMWGGFNGTETLLADRKVLLNPTVLSGDIGVAGDASDNSYHVVVMDGTTASGSIPLDTQLSDLTIRDGNANGAGANQGFGGGLFCNGSGAGHECSPSLVNLVFEDNSAVDGGALYDHGGSGGKSSPGVLNTVFNNNTATDSGAAMYDNGNNGTSSPDVEQTAFVGNDAAFSAGAMYNDGTAGVSSPTVRNVTFYGNSANFGGAMVNYGYNGGHANPQLRYVTFTQNKARFGPGGAIRNLAVTGDSSPSLSGVILWGDQAASAPFEMETESPTSPTVEYSITPECPGGAVGCINADPLLDPLQDNGGPPSMRPRIGSPAIDAGNAANCPAADQRGIARPQGAQCDIGAVELLPAEKQRCYVNNLALPPIDGKSWGTAYGYLQDALADTSCSEVWVAKGKFRTNAVSNDRSLTFLIPPRKAVYGGFVGTETTRSQRDPVINETILSGDIGVVGDASDNNYHVVVIDATGYATNVGESTRLDGFTITNGNASSASALDQVGGGLVCNGNTGFVCNPTLANLVFENNSAVYSGGGLYANGSSGMSSPSLQTVTFIGNHAGQYGGGMYSNGVDGVSSPVLTDVVFTGNTAGYAGGAVVFTGNSTAGASMPRIVSTVFENNFAVHQGGAVDSQGASATFQDVAFLGNETVPPTTAPNEGGAVLFTDGDAARNVQFTSARFFGNHSCTGGGVVLVLTHATSVARFDRATFAGNSSSDANCQGSAGGIDVVGGNTEIRDSLFANNVAAYFGGAMNVYSNATLTVDHSAFVGNSALLSGGAVSIGGASAQITNSTFSNNTSYSQSTANSKGGGAIAAGSGAVLALRNVTLAANHAFNGPGGALSIDVANGSLDTTPVSATISDSILWGDTATTENETHTDPSSSTTIDHSIIQNGCPSGSTCSTVSSADPLLGLFQMYGGYTPALMPAANSPAINSGVSCTADDQRGVARPQGPACDIGAVERRSVEDYLFNSGFDW